MNVVKITAGIGNQMFQYAFYMALRAQNHDTAIDISDFMYRRNRFATKLSDIFTITPNIITPDQLHDFVDASSSLAARFRRSVLGIHRNVPGSVFRQQNFDFDESVFSRFNTYFIGLWQSWKYFAAVDADVRAQFNYITPLDRINQVVAEAMQQSESVAIHIRRGDISRRSQFAEIGSVCTYDYYNWAIASIRQQLGDEGVHFFVFADDTKWAHSTLQLSNVTYIDWNKGPESYLDIRLMSLCKHNIIANNADSWWAAYTNTNPDKIVIAPQRWFRSTPTPDIYPQGWNTIPID